MTIILSVIAVGALPMAGLVMGYGLRMLDVDAHGRHVHRRRYLHQAVTLACREARQALFCSMLTFIPRTSVRGVHGGKI